MRDDDKAIGYRSSVRLGLFLLFLAITMKSPTVTAERALWTFDSDPGLLERHDGSDGNFQWSLSHGTLTVTTTREAAVQRVYVPLSGGPYGNESTFRIRLRFRVLSPSFAACVVGFFTAADTGNLGGTGAHIGPDVEGTVNYPFMWSGCGFQRADPGPTISGNTWYIIEYDYAPWAATWGATLFDDEQTVLQTERFTTCGTPPADVFAFANEERSQASAAITVQFDWVSWAVNEALLPDPEPDPEPDDPLKPYYAPIPVPDAEVVGLWLLDETNGPPGEENWGIYDQSGHGNHGFRAPISAINNAGNSSEPDYTSDAAVTASWNSSLNFGTSTAAYVEIPDSPSLDLTGDLTVETWVKLNSLGGADQYLVSKRNIGGAESGYFLEWASGSQTFQFHVGTSAGYEGVISENVVAVAGEWIHLAGVHDARWGEVRLYINGQLNKTAVADPVVTTNDDPLWLGNWAAGGKPANAKLDEVRLSRRVVPPSELGYHHVFGPERIIFGDAFETYADTGELLSRSGGDRNHWKASVDGPEATFGLITAHSYSADHSILSQFLNAQAGGQLVAPYYNKPVAATRDEPLIATSGWVSFTGEENVRLFFQNQIWTGVETHYDVTLTNLAGGIQYWGDTRTWKYEAAGGGTVPFSHPIDYTGDLDNWHYYRFVMDYDQKEYVSFQFDNDLWDLMGKPFLVLPEFFDPSILPVVDHNIRLLELPGASYPHTAQFALDDAAISIVKPLGSPDVFEDCFVDLKDFSLLAAHWDESGKSILDLSGDELINLADLLVMVEAWLTEPDL